MFETVVDQENYHPQSWSSRVIWFHTCLAIFVFVFGLLLNLISADATVKRNLRRIDKLSDIDDEEFENTVYFMSTVDPFYSHLMNANANSLLGRLAEKMKRHDVGKNCSVMGSCSFMRMDADNAAAVIDGIAILRKSYHNNYADFALESPSPIFDQIVLPLFCHFEPQFVN